MADLSVREFAKELGVGRKTAEKIVNSGLVKSYRLTPKTTRIPRKELERLRG